MKHHNHVLGLLFAFAIGFTPMLVVGQSSTTADQQKTEDKKTEKKDKAKKSAEQLAKEADIRALLKASGAGDLGIQVVDQMINAFRQQNPNVPAKYWEEFRAEVDADQLVELTVPTYDKHFTHDEIKELVKFYETPLGKKLVKKQPLMVQEGMVAGQKWGMELGRKLQMRLQNDF